MDVVKGVVGILPTGVKGEGGETEIFLPVDRFSYPPKSIELIESIFLESEHYEKCCF